MRQISHRPLHLAIAGAMGIFFTLAAFSATSKADQHLAGVYQSDPVPSGESGPTMFLSLGPDGTATVTQSTDHVERTTFGHWVANGDQLTVTFDAQAGQPAEPAMIFAVNHKGLQAVTWNHALWGKVTPPLAKKIEDNWHSKRHWW